MGRLALVWAVAALSVAPAALGSGVAAGCDCNGSSPALSVHRLSRVLGPSLPLLAESIECLVNSLVNVSTASNHSNASTQPAACCAALTAECLACDAGVSTEELCGWAPGTPGCPRRSGPAGHGYGGYGDYGGGAYSYGGGAYPEPGDYRGYRGGYDDDTGGGYRGGYDDREYGDYHGGYDEGVYGDYRGGYDDGKYRGNNYDGGEAGSYYGGYTSHRHGAHVASASSADGSVAGSGDGSGVSSGSATGSSSASRESSGSDSAAASEGAAADGSAGVEARAADAAAWYDDDDSGSGEDHLFIADGIFFDDDDEEYDSSDRYYSGGEARRAKQLRHHGGRRDAEAAYANPASNDYAAYQYVVAGGAYDDGVAFPGYTYNGHGGGPVAPAGDYAASYGSARSTDDYTGGSSAAAYDSYSSGSSGEGSDSAAGGNDSAAHRDSSGEDLAPEEGAGSDSSAHKGDLYEDSASGELAPGEGATYDPHYGAMYEDPASDDLAPGDGTVYGGSSSYDDNMTYDSYLAFDLDDNMTYDGNLSYGDALYDFMLYDDVAYGGNNSGYSDYVFGPGNYSAYGDPAAYDLMMYDEYTAKGSQGYDGPSYDGNTGYDGHAPYDDYNGGKTYDGNTVYGNEKYDAYRGDHPQRAYDGSDSGSASAGDASAGGELTAVGDGPAEREEDTCCQALTAECLSCQLGVDIADFCRQRPDTAGCPAPEGLSAPWARCIHRAVGASSRRGFPPALLQSAAVRRLLGCTATALPEIAACLRGLADVSLRCSSGEDLSCGRHPLVPVSASVSLGALGLSLQDLVGQRERLEAALYRDISGSVEALSAVRITRLCLVPPGAAADAAILPAYNNHACWTVGDSSAARRAAARQYSSVQVAVAEIECEVVSSDSAKAQQAVKAAAFAAASSPSSATRAALAELPRPDAGPMPMAVPTDQAMSRAAVAGIVCSVAALVGLVAVLLYVAARRRRATAQHASTVAQKGGAELIDCFDGSSSAASGIVMGVAVPPQKCEGVSAV